MLVLSRKTGEKIKIGAHVLIEILGFRAGQVRIGITAPKEINVVRTELLKKEEK